MQTPPAELEEIFQRIRPLCVDIAKHPFDLALLQRLELGISKTIITDNEIWRCLFDYIIFPLRLCFKRATSSISSSNNSDYDEKTGRCLIKVFDIFKILIQRCDGRFNRPEVIPTLLSDSFLLINNPPGSETISGSSDLIYAVIDFSFSILKSNVDYLNNFKDIQSILGQVVFALLRCLKKSGTTSIDDDMKRDLQTAIVRTLSIIFSLDESICATFLPASASALTDFILAIAVSSSREEFAIICLELWSKIIISASNISLKSSTYTDEWRRNSGLYLSKIYDRLSSTLIAHNSLPLRRVVFSITTKLIPYINVDNSILCDCKKRSLEILAASIADDQLNIDLKEVSKLSIAYGELLSKMLISICWRLPRSTRSAITSQRLVDWRCLLGYLRILNPNGISNYLLIDEHMDCLFNGLMRSIEFGSIFEEIRPSANVAEENEDLNKIDRKIRRRIPLTIPSDPSAQNMLFAVCEELARMEEIDNVYDYLFRHFALAENQLQAIFILNMIFTARQNLISVNNLDLIHSIVEFYLENLGKAISSSPIETCLILEGLGHCALILKNDFQSKLINALYVVLSSLRFSLFKDFVWSALFDFALALRHNTVLEMILINMDYLSSSLILRLRRYTLYPDSAIVLASILNLLPWESIGTLRGTIMETLSTIDRFATYPRNQDSIASLMKVLERFCVAVCDKAPSIEGSTSFENQDEKKPVPWHVDLTVDILRRIRSWICIDGIPTRLAALRVLENGLKALCNYEDQLLPIIHQNWPSVLARLNDVLENDQDERLIITSNYAFQIIVTMAKVSKNFVSRRIQDEAWPKIRLILQRYLPISKRANAMVYSQCPSFRFQLAILENLAIICKDIVSSKIFKEEIKEVCKQYDNLDILPSLKNAALTCLKDL